MQDRHIAKILRIGLLLNYYSLGQVERWCGQRLLSLDGPKADPFINLYTSLHHGLDQTLSSLAAIHGKSTNLPCVKEYFFGFYRYAYFNGCYVHSVEREIAQFFELDELAFDEDEILMCNTVKDDYELAQDGFAPGYNEVLSEFLLSYESFDELQQILDEQEIGRPSIPVRQVSNWPD